MHHVGDGSAVILAIGDRSTALPSRSQAEGEITYQLRYPLADEHNTKFFTHVACEHIAEFREPNWGAGESTDTPHVVCIIDHSVVPDRGGECTIWTAKIVTIPICDEPAFSEFYAVAFKPAVFGAHCRGENVDFCDVR